MATSEDKPTEVYLDVFTEHYYVLVEALPVKSLIAKFVSAKIIKFSDQDEILKGNTADEQARRFLRHISTPLESGKSETFCKMLDVVEKHGGQYAYLAKDIKKDILKRGIDMPGSEDVPDGTSKQAQGVLCDRCSVYCVDRKLCSVGLYDLWSRLKSGYTRLPGYSSRSVLCVKYL